VRSLPLETEAFASLVKGRGGRDRAKNNSFFKKFVRRTIKTDFLQGEDAELPNAGQAESDRLSFLLISYQNRFVLRLITATINQVKSRVGKKTFRPFYFLSSTCHVFVIFHRVAVFSK